MVGRFHERTSVDHLVEVLGKGRPLERDAQEALRHRLGVEVSQEGLSALFQPGFPGIKTFAVEVRQAPDQAIEITLIGVARDGSPVWTAARVLAHGRDGSLELHRGFDEIQPEYQSRNITVDLMQRELDILGYLKGGPNSRLTIDAAGVGRYVIALHGFGFADETEEGPASRSRWALQPNGDRERLLQAARPIIERAAQKEGLGKIAIESAWEQAKAAQTPWDFARLTLPGAQRELAEGDDGEIGIGALGREFLLAEETPPWRASLYLHRDPDKPNTKLGNEYRRRKTARSEARLARELTDALDTLKKGNRAAKLRALKTLGMIGPAYVASELKPMAEDSDRRVAAEARRALRQIGWSSLPVEMLSYAQDLRKPPARRALIYRVLAEYYPSKLDSQVSMLRVHPDARIQRTIAPLLAASPNPGPNLAVMLAANPWPQKHEDARPGLLDLRIELIERLTRLADPCTLPALMGAYRTENAPPPAEMLALSRALVTFPDPRAQRALTEVARRLERPQVP